MKSIALLPSFKKEAKGYSFSFCRQKENRIKRKSAKTSWLRGRKSDFPNHSMNSLRSDSISYFVAQIVFANPRLNIDSENPTYSKDLLVRNVFENLFEETWSTVR